jgi:hypothetical protein
LYLYFLAQGVGVADMGDEDHEEGQEEDDDEEE